MDLKDFVGDLTPSVLTPKIGEFSQLPNPKKPKKVAQTVVISMIDQYNKDGGYKVPKMISHNREMIAVRFLEKQAFEQGVWAEMSLLILPLSYSEQMTLIEAWYPKTIQQTAKAFAAVFSKEGHHDYTGSELTVQSDPELVDKLDSTNAGIAMILAAMDTQHIHADDVTINQQMMDDLAKDMSDAIDFTEDSKDASDANHYRDSLNK